MWEGGMTKLKMKLDVSPSRLKAMKLHWNKTKEESPAELGDLRKRMPLWVLSEIDGK